MNHSYSLMVVQLRVDIVVVTALNLLVHFYNSASLLHVPPVLVVNIAASIHYQISLTVDSPFQQHYVPALISAFYPLMYPTACPLLSASLQHLHHDSYPCLSIDQSYLKVLAFYGTKCIPR
uniref:Putative secreted protein n=1 Tax=Panstrongylus lignarius TaxID=156445 RepID=A0A224XTF2_9HEMI